MALLDILGGISSLAGLLGASAAQRRAQQEQQMQLADLARQNDALYQNTLGNNHADLMAQAGAGGDAIAALGRNLGDSLAGAGVWNSSATAGALQQAQFNQQSAIGQLARQMQAAAMQQRQNGLLDIGRMKLGIANQNQGQAQNDLSGARGGLASFLGGIAQQNLMRSGANAYRPQTTPINGNAGRDSLPGNAGYQSASPLTLGSFGSGAGSVEGNALGQTMGYAPLRLRPFPASFSVLGR